MRFSAPIFTYKNIIEQAGIILKINPKEEEESDDSLVFEEANQDIESMAQTIENDYKNLSLSELKEQLKEAVKDENYETAAKLRDEISKR